ncbi:MAG: hypothetical protein O3C27_11305 [Actinomycetota bacterium]|nr:hypothetical protein [Actinomycetota bacterium]
MGVSGDLTVAAGNARIGGPTAREVAEFLRQLVSFEEARDPVEGLGSPVHLKQGFGISRGERLQRDHCWHPAHQ